ncbi:CPC_1213 family protein [Hydrogenoanaerobacterium sp.]|nr:CPC_1213 family protein [Hydrogenoanaerobacterium sp.]
MSTDNKKKSTKNGKKEDGKFHSKNIKHDPQAESARAVFGLNNANEENKK